VPLQTTLMTSRKQQRKRKARHFKNKEKQNGTVPLQTALMTSNRNPQVKLLRGQRRVPLGFYPCSVKCVQNNGDEADTFTVHTHTHTGEIDSEKSIRLFWHLFTPVRNAVELLGPLSAKKFQSTNFLWS